MDDGRRKIGAPQAAFRLEKLQALIEECKKL